MAIDQILIALCLSILIKDSSVMEETCTKAYRSALMCVLGIQNHVVNFPHRYMIKPLACFGLILHPGSIDQRKSLR